MQKEFIERSVQVLERLNVTYAITGSIASNYWGAPRFTHDLDLLVVMDPVLARLTAAAFPEEFYASPDSAADAARTHHMFNVIDTKGTMKADFWVSSGDPFSREMLSRRRRVPVVGGLEAFVATPEDVLLHKLVWHQITPSDRQLGDAAGIAAVQAGNLDLAYMRGWASRQGTAALLEEVLAGKYLKAT